MNQAPKLQSPLPWPTILWLVLPVTLHCSRFGSAYAETDFRLTSYELLFFFPVCSLLQLVFAFATMLRTEMGSPATKPPGSAATTPQLLGIVAAAIAVCHCRFCAAPRPDLPGKARRSAASWQALARLLLAALLVMLLRPVLAHLAVAVSSDTLFLAAAAALLINASSQPYLSDPAQNHHGLPLNAGCFAAVCLGVWGRFGSLKFFQFHTLISTLP